MTPRSKKLIGLVVMPAWLIAYVAAIVTIADKVPDFWLARLAYFVVSGIAWALPVIPLMNWMNKDPRGGVPQ